MKRLLNIKELSEYLGVSREYLRQWREDKDFPKPIRGKLWDSKAVEQYLDNLSKINTESSWNKALSERMGRMRGLEPPTSRITICEESLYFNGFFNYSHSIGQR